MSSDPTSRNEWIEPIVENLDVRETESDWGAGPVSDGDWADGAAAS